MGFLSGLFSGNKKRTQQLNDYLTTGVDAYNTGRQYLSAAYSGLDDLDKRYTDQLAGGALPDDVARAFTVAHGKVADDAQRSRAGFAAELVQRARASGGQIDPQALVDANVDNSAAVDAATFNANNQLSANEAQVRLDETNKLLDSIERERTTKAGLAQSDVSMGQQMYQAALELIQNRSLTQAKLAASILAPWVGMGGNLGSSGSASTGYH